MNPVVYDWFLARMQEQFNDVPFYATQSQMLEQKNLPSLWLTMESAMPTNDRLTIGDPALYRESGNVNAVFLTKSGLGPRDVLVAAQRFADHMRDTYQQAKLTEETGRTGTLRLPVVGAPEPDPFENGNWLMCTVGITYTYDSVRGAAQVLP